MVWLTSSCMAASAPVTILILSANAAVALAFWSAVPLAIHAGIGFGATVDLGSAIFLPHIKPASVWN